MTDLDKKIDEAFANRELLKQDDYRDAVLTAVEMLDKGEARVAEPGDGDWIVHGWLQKACILYFSVAEMEVMDVGPYQFYDKVPLKRDLQAAKVRVVPTGTVRYGAYIEPGVVVMPSFVNIGARVGSGTMVDTWATVGSCAQIGANVHLSGGVGIGGVLEPAGARPVIVEDGAFLGSRSIVVEGCSVGERAVLGANVVLTASTSIVDVTGDEPTITKGKVPPNSVVIPGTIPKQFKAGEFQVPCALIIGKRKASTDLKTSLNDTLREFAVSV
jgi:2,3,4,5-tetrahydropyridine-2-carboxylate N-succinyltransferase